MTHTNTQPTKKTPFLELCDLVPDRDERKETKGKMYLGILKFNQNNLKMDILSLFFNVFSFLSFF